MNTKEIKEILQLMKDFELCELEIEKEGMKIKLKKPGLSGMDEGALNAMNALRLSSGQSGSLPSASAQAAAPAVAAGAVDDAVSVRSPMVGTFYASPAPDQPAYAAVGQKVREGVVLCIIEAMKLMNEIKSEISGTITEVLAANGKPVEFDQTLFKIRKG